MDKLNRYSKKGKYHYLKYARFQDEEKLESMKMLSIIIKLIPLSKFTQIRKLY